MGRPVTDQAAVTPLNADVAERARETRASAVARRPLVTNAQQPKKRRGHKLPHMAAPVLRVTIRVSGVSFSPASASRGALGIG